MAQALESVSSLKAEEYIASIRYVPLETTDSCFLGDIYKIIPWGDFYYVSDLEKVFLFSTDGKFLRKFGKKGRGPEEYTALTDFVVDPDNGDIYLLGLGKILVYSLDGKFLRSFEMDVDWQVATFDGNGHIVFISAVAFEERPLLIVCDKSGQVVRNIFGMKCFCHLGYFNWIQEKEGRVYYKEEFSDTLVYLDSSLDKHPYALVDLENYKFQPSHFSMEMMDQWSKYYRLNGVFDFKRTMIINVQQGLMDQGKRLNSYLFDKESGEIGVFEKNTDQNGLRIGDVVYVPRAACEDKLVCVIPTLNLLENENIRNPELREIISQMDENANPVLAIMVMK